MKLCPHLISSLSGKLSGKLTSLEVRIELRLATSDDLVSNIFSDHYFESMILLKYEFGWEWEDVLFFVTNQRSNPKELSQG